MPHRRAAVGEIYAFVAVLMMILPLRAAGFVMASAAKPVFTATLVLFSTIVAVQTARFSFGNRGALWALADWQFLFAAAIVAAHLAMKELRRKVLLRTIFCVVFIAAMLACLF